MRLRKAAPWVLGGLSALVLALHAIAVALQPQPDFAVYRMGGQHVLGASLYSSHVMEGGRSLLFTYTPVAALLFSPLSHLSRSAGQLVWDLVNIVVLATLIAVSSAAVRQKQLARSDWQLALLLLAPIGLLWWPVRYGFDLGQINVLLTLMIIADLTMHLSWRGRTLPRGVLVGVAAAIKLTPLIFVPFLLLTRQWRPAKNAVLSFFVVTLTMVALAPSSSWNYFTRYAFDVSRIGSTSIADNQTVSAALMRTGLHPSHTVVDVVVVSLCCAGLALAVVAYRGSSRFLGILVCGATGLMVSPISWQHHYVWSVPLVVWLLFGVDRPKQGAVWAALATIFFLLKPPIGPVVHEPNLIAYMWDNAYVLATVAFMALVSLMLWTRHRASLRTGDAGHRSEGGETSFDASSTELQAPRPMAQVSVAR